MRPFKPNRNIGCLCMGQLCQFTRFGPPSVLIRFNMRFDTLGQVTPQYLEHCFSSQILSRTEPTYSGPSCGTFYHFSLLIPPLPSPSQRHSDSQCHFFHAARSSTEFYSCTNLFHSKYFHYFWWQLGSGKLRHWPLPHSHPLPTLFQLILLKLVSLFFRRTKIFHQSFHRCQFLHYFISPCTASPLLIYSIWA